MAIDAEKKAKVLKYRWVVFVTLAIAYFFVYFHRTTGGAISGEMQDWFNITKSEVGMLASAYLWAYTLMQIPSGVLTDKMGPRKAATIFILLLAAGSVLCAVSSMESIKSYPLMWVGKFIIGIGAAVIYIPIMKVLAVWFRKNEFASMSGILLLVGNVGGIAAATPMVMLIQGLGFADTYFILTGITVVIGILTWFLVRNHPNEMGLPGIEEIVADETGEPIKESTSAKMGTKEALKLTFTSGMKFWPLAIWFFFMYGTIMLWQASQAGSFYSEVGGLDSSTYAMFITMVGIGMVVGCPLAGRLSDKVLHSRKKVIIAGTVAYTIVWAVIWLTGDNTDFVSNTTFQYIINFLFGFFGGFFVVSYAQIKELYPIAMAGTSTAALNLFPFAGGAILALISGPIVEASSFKTLWMAAFIMMVIACVCAFMSVEKQKD